MQTNSMRVALRRNYHPHVVDVVERLIAGIRTKGPEELIDMSNVAQVRATFDCHSCKHMPCKSPAHSVALHAGMVLPSS